MALVTGVLSDYQLGHLTGEHPTIVFQPSGPAVDATGVFAPERATIVPISATGYFEADLQPTDTLRPAIYYTVSLQWGRGRRAQLPWRLSVPTGGGILADLLNVAAAPGLVWIGVDPPPTAGVPWLDPVTGDLYEWSN